MAKINNTFGAGFLVPHDFDAQRFEQEQKKRKRQRTEDEIAKDCTQRQTFQIPFSVLCDTCSGRIGSMTKVYAQISKVRGERYAETIQIYRQVCRCIYCNEKIEFRTDPAKRSYAVVSGAKRIQGDWKEDQDAEEDAKRERAAKEDNEEVKQQAYIEEHQQQALRAEKLAEFLERGAQCDRNAVIDNALQRLQSREAESSEAQLQPAAPRVAVPKSSLPTEGISKPSNDLLIDFSSGPVVEDGAPKLVPKKKAVGALSRLADSYS